jgi:glycosyltransferase involved in cell wall biosynthesis
LAGNIENYDYFNREIAPMLEVRIDQLGSGFTKLEALDMILSNAKRPEIIYFGEANFEEKIQLYQLAYAFINPIAWEEPFGLVMAEAGACGAPVISFARGAAAEIIIDGKTGFLVKNAREMVKAVRKIDHIWRPECREHVEAKFSAKAVAERYREVYDLILEKEKERKSGI